VATKKAAKPAPRGGQLSVRLGLVTIGVRHAPLMRSDVLPSAKTCCAEHRVPLMSGTGRSQCGECADYAEETVMLYPVDADGDYDPKGDRFVEVDKDALTKVSDKVVELEAAVPVEDLDPLRFEKAWSVWPDAGQEKWFGVLLAVLKESGKALVGATVMGGRSRMLVMRWSPVTQTVVMHQCTYDASMRWPDIELVQSVTEDVPELSAEERQMVDMLLGTMGDEFNAPAEDEYAAGLEQLIKASAQGVPLPEAKAEAPAPPVADLMEALRGSVAAASKKKPVAKKPRAKAKV
jgi:DNA end-binding protein Ku